jgi:HEAT repeats
MKMRMWRVAGVAAFVLSAMAGVAVAASEPDSKRMERAKDFIADEQWVRAIAELQAVAADPREANRDEALYWLAQSEHEIGDHSAAIETIVRLERQFPRSRWVRVARSLRVEIAQQLNRYDVLWAVVAPPAPPAPPAPRPATAPTAVPPVPAMVPPPPPPSARPPRPPVMAAPVAPALPPSPPPAAAGVAPLAPPLLPVPAGRPRAGSIPTPMMPPGYPVALTPAARPVVTPLPARAPAAFVPGAEFFLPTPYPPDTDLKIEALNGLLEGHSERVIPLLREIALDANNPDEARRAVLVLARSHRPEARTTVVDVARRGPEPVRLAAIREMGRFEGTTVTAELMQVYSMSTAPRIKRQVVSSLGDRSDNVSLLTIARAEADPAVRNIAIVTLGRLPDAGPQLRTLYLQAPAESRMAVLSALFTSKDEDELIRIAKTEKDPLLRQRARLQLRMLGTPKALRFLEETANR